MGERDAHRLSIPKLKELGLQASAATKVVGKCHFREMDQSFSTISYSRPMSTIGTLEVTHLQSTINEYFLTLARLACFMQVVTWQVVLCCA
jgi:hypothetical protein